jgi:uridine kinase
LHSYIFCFMFYAQCSMMNMAKLILGVAGEMGSGKGVIAKYVVLEHKGNMHRFSTMLRDVLQRMYIEESRDNIAKLSLMLRQNFGEEVFANTMYHDTQNDQHDIVVIDGIRRMADITYLKQLPNFKFIYVDADLETRYKRVVGREENENDAKKTLDEFKRDQELESETQIRDLKNYADYVIENGGAFQDLYKRIDEIINENIAK